MTFQKRSKMPYFALTVLIVYGCVAGVITDDSVRSAEPADSSPSQTGPQGSNLDNDRNDISIKQLIEPLAKRYATSRDAKPVYLADESGSSAGLEPMFYDDNDDTERMQFLSQLMDKRASAGFMPMRGRKSTVSALETLDAPYVDGLEKELDALNRMEKRRAQSFMPMRGRRLEHAFPRYYHRAMPFKSNSPSVSDFQLDSISGYGQKRKGMGFFGARGKRSTVRV